MESSIHNTNKFEIEKDETGAHLNPLFGKAIYISENDVEIKDVIIEDKTTSCIDIDDKTFFISSLALRFVFCLLVPLIFIFSRDGSFIQQNLLFVTYFSINIVIVLQACYVQEFLKKEKNRIYKTIWYQSYNHFIHTNLSNMGIY